jgi:hypothetical protein
MVPGSNGSGAHRPGDGPAATITSGGGRPLAAPTMARFKRPLINAFIILHLVAIGFWSLPLPVAPVTFVNGLTRPYVLGTGLWQSWDMFSPEPKSINVRMDTTLTLRDGSRLRRPFIPNELGLLASYRRERYRKWAHDNVRIDANSGLWEPVALYFAKSVSNEANPVVQVELHRHWSETRVPTDPSQRQLRTPWRRFTFYRRPIAAGDLR